MPRRKHALARLISQPVYLYAFQTLREQLKLIFPTRQYQLFDTKKLPYGFNYGIDMLDRLSLLKTGRLCTLLIQKLLCIENQLPIRNQFRLGTAISSRHNYFDKVEPECVASWEGHCGYVTSIAFHPTEPLILTGSSDNTAKLWRMNSDRTAAECVTTFTGHNYSINYATFHPTEPLIVTGSIDKTAKLWRMNSARTAAEYVATLAGHSHFIDSATFHPSKPLIVTSSHDKTAKLWRMNSERTAVEYVATLEGHGKFVYSVAFHPTEPLIATVSYDKTIKLWK